MTTLQVINIGVAPDDPEADMLQAAMAKVVANQNTTIAVADSALAAATTAQAAASAADAKAGLALAAALPVGVSVAKTSDTELTVSVVGADSIIRSGYFPVEAPSVITGVPWRVFDITGRQFGAQAGTLSSGPDVTDAIQDAINAAQTHGEGRVLIPKLTDGAFWFSALTIPHEVVFAGAHRFASRLMQMPTARGPAVTIAHPPGAAAADGVKAMLCGFYLGGGGAGVIRARGTTTAGSDVITDVTGAGGAQEGWIVQAVGTPEWSLIESIGGGTIVMSENATVSNAPFKRGLRLREAYTLAATTTAGQRFVAMAGTTGLRAGMRVRGTGVESDATMIEALTPGGITLDRPANASGATSLLFYVSNDGIYLPDASLAPGYDPLLVYAGADVRDVFVERFSGWAVNAQNRRAQTRWRGGKMEGCDTGGMRCEKIADAYAHEVNSGSHWGPAVKVVDCSAFKVIGGEMYNSYDTWAGHAIEFHGCNELQVANADVNGRALIVSGAGMTNNIATFTSVNFKFKSSEVGPDGTQDAFLRSDNAKVIARDCGFVPDTETHERPNHIAYSKGPRALVVVDVDGWPDSTSDWRCPYAVAPSLTASGGHIDMRYIDTLTWQRKTHSVGLT